MSLKKNLNRKKRIKRIRAKISGTAIRPRLAVFRSLKHIYVQLINDETASTLVATSDFELKNTKSKRSDQAFEIGQKIAEKATGKKIQEIVFDKRGYKYHGIIKAIAQGARKGGLKF